MMKILKKKNFLLVFCFSSLPNLHLSLYIFIPFIFLNLLKKRFILNLDDLLYERKKNELTLWGSNFCFRKKERSYILNTHCITLIKFFNKRDQKIFLLSIQTKTHLLKQQTHRQEIFFFLFLKRNQ